MNLPRFNLLELLTSSSSEPKRITYGHSAWSIKVIAMKCQAIFLTFGRSCSNWYLIFRTTVWPPGTLTRCLKKKNTDLYLNCCDSFINSGNFSQFCMAVANWCCFALVKILFKMNFNRKWRHNDVQFHSWNYWFVVRTVETQIDIRWNSS